MKLLWLSRHAPLDRQLAALRERFGRDAVIDQDRDAFRDAADIAARLRAGGYDECVVVAPLSVIAELVRLGIKPLRAEMARCEPADAETTVPGSPPRYYRFDRFVRIVELRMVTEELC